MEEKQNPKLYDLENRTFEFARDVRELVKKLHKTIANIEDCKQLARASGSVGANYIEANEAISKKDFTHRIKIYAEKNQRNRCFGLGLWMLATNKMLSMNEYA